MLIYKGQCSNHASSCSYCRERKAFRNRKGVRGTCGVAAVTNKIKVPVVAQAANSRHGKYPSGKVRQPELPGRPLPRCILPQPTGRTQDVIFTVYHRIKGVSYSSAVIPIPILSRLHPSTSRPTWVGDNDILIRRWAFLPLAILGLTTANILPT